MCIERIGQVIGAEEPDSGVVIADVGGVYRRISTALLVFDGIEVVPGDWLRIHAGMAVEVLTDVEARDLVRAHEAVGSMERKGR
ncbi:MAG: HypC/HybG/HupF family hydrogenase formation chaperone [Acidimicrobiales bacterium]